MTDDTPAWVDTLDAVEHSGKLTSASVDGDELVIKFFAGRIANTYYTLTVPLDAVEVTKR